jgi:hypothetical protein
VGESTSPLRTKKTKHGVGEVKEWSEVGWGVRGLAGVGSVREVRG